MPDSCLYITYSNPQAVYYPGTSVTGVANLDLRESIKARSLKIIVDGRAYTHWSVTRSRTVRTTSTQNYTIPYHATVIYATGESLAWQAPNGSKEVLPAGSYKFPFTFLLPPNCAPSFESGYGYIRYMVKIELDQPWRFNKTDKKLFTVVPMFDLNAIPQASIPIRDVVTKNLGIVLFRHGKITVECEIPKMGFVPGEMIVIDARITNESSKTITKGHVKLVEHSSYVAYEHGRTLEQGPFVGFSNCFMSNRRTLTRKLATGHQQLAIYKNSKGNAQVYLQVPSTVPSFNTCPIISVEYCVEIKFETNATLNGDIETSCPLIVGTIPVRSVNFAATPSAPSIESPSLYPVSPSAPPMESSHLYPELNGNTSFHPPPPSYEESVNGLSGTLIDTEYIEPFAPRYPFYPAISSNGEGSNSKKCEKRFDFGK